MRLLVLPGDGIGPEIAAATVAVLNAASERFGLALALVEDTVGHDSLKRYGTTVRPELVDTARGADGLILGPTAGLDFHDDARGEINPSKHFRKTFDLFANIRPARTYPAIPRRSDDFDLVVVRENTEGFYADRNMESGSGELLVTAGVALSLRRITRRCSARIAREAFDLARRRRKHVTIVHKASVLAVTDGLFLGTCRDVARGYPDIAVDDVLVDTMMAHLVRAPHRFDVVVTTNMFGDILTDLTSELSGSLGLGGSLNAGADYAMAQAVHGCAPDIAGRNLANPFSLILSAGLLLGWLGERRGLPAFEGAAAAVDAAVAAAIAAGDMTTDVGGRLGTRETGHAVAARLRGV